MKEKLLSVADMLILQRVSLLIPLVPASLPLASHSPLRSVFGFYGALTALSGLLKTKPPEQRRLFVWQKLRALLPAYVESGGISFPTAPELRVVGVDLASVAIMKSHAKCPVKITFTTAPAAALAHQPLRLRLCCVRPLARQQGRGARRCAWQCGGCRRGGRVGAHCGCTADAALPVHLHVMQRLQTGRPCSAARRADGRGLR